MLITTLPRLCCPSYLDGNDTCAGELKLTEAKKKKGTEILFGTLSCQECEATFPILAGIALLVNDVDQYLQLHVKGVAALVKDSEIPEIYRENYLLAKGAIETGFTEEDLESQRVNALYFMNHYLSAGKTKKPFWRPKKGVYSAEIDRLMKNFWDQGPFSKISEWAKPLRNQSAIELGCGVGGVATVLAKSIDSYLGVDSAFTSIALARHVHLGAPYPRTLRIPQDLFNGPLTEKTPPLKSAKGNKVDFVVGELENIPVVKGEFDLTIALNTIDMIEDPCHLPRLQFDLLKEEGIAIQSSPYIWHEMVADNLRRILPKKISSSSAAVEYLYESVGFKIYKKIDHLPWLFLKHFRQIELYSVHIFAARKGGKPPARAKK